MTLRDQVQGMGQLIRSTAAVYGAYRVQLFGSAARGEERPDSDIDFIVALEPGRTLLDLAKLEMRLEALLGRRVDVVTEGGLREPLRSTALREALNV